MVSGNPKVSALGKLIDYTASGIGPVAGPMLAPWKVGQDAKVKLINAEADSVQLIVQAQAEAQQVGAEPANMDSDSLAFEARGITQRIEFQEKKRQANIAATVREAAADLSDKEVPDHKPDPDWTARFFDCVQDVFSEDMRKLWTRVLAWEVQEPGSTSLRTLDVLRNMTTLDAVLFQYLCSYVIAWEFVFKTDEIQQDHPALSIDNLQLLEDAGLINADSNLTKTLPALPNAPFRHLSYQDWFLRVPATDPIVRAHVPVCLLTTAGSELYRFTERTPRAGYLESFSRFLRTKNIELSIARVVDEHSDGGFRLPVYRPFDDYDPAYGDILP